MAQKVTSKTKTDLLIDELMAQVNPSVNVNHFSIVNVHQNSIVGLNYKQRANAN